MDIKKREDEIRGNLKKERSKANILLLFVIILMIVIAVAVFFLVYKNYTKIVHTVGISITNPLYLGASIDSVNFVDNETLDIRITRNSAPGNITGVRFVFDDFVGYSYYTDEEPLEISETRTYRIPGSSLSPKLNNFNNIDKVSVYYTYQAYAIKKIDTTAQLSSKPVASSSKGGGSAGRGKKCTADPLEVTCGTWVCGNKQNNCDKTVSCGTCLGDQTCENGSCVSPSCNSESNEAFCLRQNKTCENVTANDNCGLLRTVSCGTCNSANETCSNNVCIRQCKATDALGCNVTGLACYNNNAINCAINNTNGCYYYSGFIACTSPQVCSNGSCITPPECTSNADCIINNKLATATCNNTPDNNPLTWDSAPANISTCNLGTGKCIIPTQPTINSACSFDLCAASCDLIHLCANTECDMNDICVGNDYYDYYGVANNCTSGCSCQNNSCNDIHIFTNDIRCSLCGNGIIQTGETCDDNNTINNDGCSNVCQIESGWSCSSQPSVCTRLCGNGVINPGEQCDGGSCCNLDCTFKSSSTICRVSQGICDTQEACTGTSASCPADLKLTSICRASIGICDISEYCNGVSNDCPTNGFSPSTTICRPSTGECDITEKCTGINASCPTNSFNSSGTSCSGGICDGSGTCVSSGTCYLSNGGFQNWPIPAYTKTMNISYDATPNYNLMDGLVMFANKSVLWYTDYSISMRFNETGYIDAYDNFTGTYHANAIVPYTSGTSYHFRLVVDLVSKTYNAYITPQGQSEIYLISNHKLKDSPTQLNTLSMIADYAGSTSHRLCNLQVTGTNILAPTLYCGNGECLGNATYIENCSTCPGDCGSCVNHSGNILYVTQSGSGSKNGADWNNAYQGLPATLQRNYTYYIADGTYSAYTFDDAASGTQLITIKKATASDHGTNTGWSVSLGDGRAVFGPLTFTSDYYVFDGNYEYGFKSLGNYQGFTVDIQSSSDHITIRNSDIDGNFATTSGYHTGGSCNTVDIRGQYIIIEHCDVHNAADDGIGVYGSNVNVFDSKIHKLHGCGSDAGCGPCFNGHSDGFGLLGNLQNIDIRRNIVYDIKSTSAFMADQGTDPLYTTNLTLENNIFYTPYVGLVVYIDEVHGGKIFNNVIWGKTDGPRYGGLSIGPATTDLYIYNNIILNINFAHLGATYNPSQHHIDYNVFAMLAASEYTKNINDIVASPLLKNIIESSNLVDFPIEVVPENFSLQSSSPAINAGFAGNSTIQIPATDYYGNSRVNAVDIGGIEYQGTVSQSCSLSSALWNQSSAYIGDIVQLNVLGDSCSGKMINYTVYKSIWYWFDTKVMSTSTQGSTTWNAGWNGASYETGTYYFVATVSDNASATRTSGNLAVSSPVTYCGDGSCNGNENCSTCPGDCGICPVNPCAEITQCANYTNSANCSANLCSISGGCSWNSTSGKCQNYVAPASECTKYAKASGGVTSGTCNSEATACTLGYVDGIAAAGDTVCLMPGTYNTQISPSNSGSSGNYITFKAQNRRTAIIDGAKSLFNIVSLDSKDFIRIEGLELKRPVANVFGISNSNYIEIVDNYIHDTGTPQPFGGGIYAYSSSSYNNNILISNNEITSASIAINIKGTDITIRNNYLHHTEDDPILIEGNTILIENNTISSFVQPVGGEHPDGISFGKVTRNCIIRNNRLSDYTQMIYFGLNGDTNGVVENLEIYGNVIYGNERYANENGAFTKGVFIDTTTTTGHKVANVSIHSNTFGYLGDNYNAISMTGSSGTVAVLGFIKIYDNIIWGCNGQNGIGLSNVFIPFTTSDYNLFYLGTKPSFEGNHSKENTNPGFEDYIPPTIGNPSTHLDFHLQSNSQVIDAGNPSLGSVVTLPSPFKDIDGVTRPQNGSYDIGAYEFNGTIPSLGNYTTSLSQFGITWTFNQSVQYGTFANGDYWVVGSVKITSITPASVVSGGRTINGAMLNVDIDNLPSGGIPGRDQPYQSFDSGASTFSSTYNAARPGGNDLSADNPLNVPAGSSLISTVSLGTCTSSTCLRTAAVLTILPSALDRNDYYFRPSMYGAIKTVRFNKDQLDYSKLETLTITSAMQTALINDNRARIHQQVGDSQGASIERMFERPWLDYQGFWSGDLLHPSENMPNYGDALAQQVGTAALLLNLNINEDARPVNEEKETLLIRFLQLGIDNYGVIENGGIKNWPPDGGHDVSQKWPIVFAGIMFNYDGMKNIGVISDIRNPNYILLEDAKSFYVMNTDPAYALSSCTVSNANNINYGCGGYTSDDIGLPDYGIRHGHYPTWTIDDKKDWSSGYRASNGNALGGAVFAAKIMEAKTGAKTLWNHDAFFDYEDRYYDVCNVIGYSDSYRTRFFEQTWLAYKSQFGCTWTRINSGDTYSQGFYNCSNQKIRCSWQAGTMSGYINASSCGNYSNQRACEYDPCNLVGGCHWTGSSCSSELSELKPSIGIKNFIEWLKNLF